MEKDLVNGTFKDHHEIKTSKYNFTSAKENFIQELITNINKRFPDKALMTSFCIFGLRPITFLSDEDLDKWDNEFLEILIKHFAEGKSHKVKDSESKRECTVKSSAIVDGPGTRE